MRFEPSEIQAIADALAPLVADTVERRLRELPELAMSVPEAAEYVRVDESVIRSAIKAGRLPHCKIGHQLRIRRCDLFQVKEKSQ